jgi:hypothetical protein
MKRRRTALSVIQILLDLQVDCEKNKRTSGGKGAN